MWTDSKTVWVLKFGSTVQKLFDFEIRRLTPLLHKNNVKIGIIQLSITFEQSIQSSKTKLFWNLPTCGQQVMIFNYLNILYI